jgi:hypothetical protein
MVIIGSTTFPCLLFASDRPSVSCLCYLLQLLSKVAKFLRANGITYLKVREQTLEILWKSEYFYSSPVVPSLTEPLQKALDWALNEKLKSGMDDLGDDISMY